MDSALSDARNTVALLREAARRGDWRSAGERAAILKLQALPASHEDLREYLCCLKEAIIVAKASRAHVAASLVRLNAAAGFHHAGFQGPAERHNFGDSADFQRPPRPPRQSRQ